MEGTAAHYVLQYILENNIRAVQLIGQTVTVTEGPRTVRLAIDTLVAADIDLAGDFIREVAKISGDAWIETLVDLGFLEKDMFGRVDLSHFSHDGILSIVDFKYGRLDVDVKTSFPEDINQFLGTAIEYATQLLIYALGELRRLTAQGAKVLWVRLVIIQPRSILPGPKIKQVVIPVSVLWAFERALARAIGETHNPNARFRIGKWCRYCPALGTCPASDNSAAVVGSLLNLDMAEADTTQVAALLDLEDFVQYIFKKAHKRAAQDLHAGKPVADYGLYTSTKHRVWSDEETAKAKIFGQFGLKGLKAPTPHQVEGLGVLGKDISATYSIRPPGDPVVAKKGDKRAPYIAKTAGEIFSGIFEK